MKSKTDMGQMITLTGAQMQDIFDVLDGLEDGIFDEEIEWETEDGGTLIVTAVGRLETDGYWDTGYPNGTGAWEETRRQGSVSLDATLYDDEGDEIECFLDGRHEKEADEHLNARH